MKKHNSILMITGLVLSCHLVLSGCHTNKEQVSEGKQTESSSYASQKAEAIVVAEIQKDGYMQQIGNDRVFVEGTIPYTALFLDSLLPPKDYVFDKAHILHQLEKGYVIQAGDKLYYYSPEKGEKAGLVSLKEAKKISKNAKAKTVKKEKNSKKVAGIDLPTDDGFLLKNEKQIIGKTDAGIIVEHDGHSHFIFFEDLKNSKWSYLIPKDTRKSAQRQATATNGGTPVLSNTGDGYVFDPKDVVFEDENGYTVRHGDHYHYIPKYKGNTLETPSLTVQPSSPQVHHQTQPNHSAEEINRAKQAGKYTTSDGYIFNASDTVDRLRDGYLAMHGKHQHWIPKAELSAAEIQAAEDFLNKKVGSSSNSHEHSQNQANSELDAKLKAKIEEKVQSIMKRYGLKKDQIIVAPEKNAIIYPHGTHHHAEPIDEKKPFSGGHSHDNHEMFEAEVEGTVNPDKRVLQGAELQDAITLLRQSIFNNQALTVGNGQKRVSFVFDQRINAKLGINVKVKLTTPDGKNLEKLSGYVFGKGIGNIANFEFDKAYKPGDTFTYTLSSRDFPEVTVTDSFTIKPTLAYKLYQSAFIKPFYAGDKELKIILNRPLKAGESAHVNAFVDFHDTAFLESNYRIGEISIPIPQNNLESTKIPGNKIPITFLINPYEYNESYYVIEVPVLDPKEAPKENELGTPILPNNPMELPKHPMPKENPNDYIEEWSEDEMVPETSVPNEEQERLEHRLREIAKFYKVPRDHFVMDLNDRSWKLNLLDGTVLTIPNEVIQSTTPVELMLQPSYEEEVLPDEPIGPVPDKKMAELEAKMKEIAAQHNAQMQDFIIEMDGSVKLKLPNGEIIPIPGLSMNR